MYSTRSNQGLPAGHFTAPVDEREGGGMTFDAEENCARKATLSDRTSRPSEKDEDRTDLVPTGLAGLCHGLTTNPADEVLVYDVPWGKAPSLCRRRRRETRRPTVAEEGAPLAGCS